MLAIVCLFVLQTVVQVCSAQLPYDEAMMVYRYGAQQGTTLPRVYTEDTPEFRAIVARNNPQTRQRGGTSDVQMRPL